MVSYPFLTLQDPIASLISLHFKTMISTGQLTLVLAYAEVRKVQERCEKETNVLFSI